MTRHKIQSDRPTSGRRKEMAHDVVAEILDNGLRNSTWRRVYPGAYDNLCQLRESLELTVLGRLESWDA